MKCDIVVIGAGVAGCAIARELSRKHPEKKIVVLEKREGVGLEASSLNSGVLHTGLHQKPGSLKARLAFEGNKLAVRYHQEKNLPIMNCGMLVAIPWSALWSGLMKELGSLLGLIRRGREQRINFKFLGPVSVKKIEPRIRAMGGIFIPAVWVIDSIRFVRELWKDAVANGVSFFFSSGVEKIEISGSSYCVKAGRLKVETGILINAAGVFSDEIAAMAGILKYKIYPWRGEYYEIIGKKRKIISHLVYPAAPKNSPSKGIHFGPRLDGRLFLGPNARSVPRKNYYEEDKTPKEEFLKAAKKFFPELEESELVWSYSGIRPKTADTPAEDDFIISIDRAKPLLLNLVGIESPGLSAAMAIAEYCCAMLDKAL